MAGGRRKVHPFGEIDVAQAPVRHPCVQDRPVAVIEVAYSHFLSRFHAFLEYHAAEASAVADFGDIFRPLCQMLMYSLRFCESGRKPCASACPRRSRTMSFGS